MDKKQLRIERMRIMNDINALNARSEAGEDVLTGLRHCGKRLDKLGKHNRRADVMDANAKTAKAIPIVNKQKYKKKNPNRQYKRYDISPEIRALAEQNEIKYNTLKDRIFFRGWDEYKAATEPVPTPAATLSVDGYKQLIAEGWTEYRIIKEKRGTQYRLRKIKEELAKAEQLEGVGV